MTDGDAKRIAVDRIADQFSELVVRHDYSRAVVLRERAYDVPSVNTVISSCRMHDLKTIETRVELEAFPVPGGWAYAASPRDLMRLSR